MRWVVLVARFLFVIGISLLVVAAPEKPGWQFVAGFFYPLRLLIVLNLVNSPLDIIDMVDDVAGVFLSVALSLVTLLSAAVV